MQEHVEKPLHEVAFRCLFGDAANQYGRTSLLDWWGEKKWHGRSDCVAPRACWAGQANFRMKPRAIAEDTWAQILIYRADSTRRSRPWISIYNRCSGCRMGEPKEEVGRDVSRVAYALSGQTAPLIG